MPTVTAYLIADDSRQRYLLLEGGRIPRWVPDRARATRFSTLGEARIARDAVPGGYLAEPVKDDSP